MCAPYNGGNGKEEIVTVAWRLIGNLIFAIVATHTQGYIHVCVCFFFCWLEKCFAKTAKTFPRVYSKVLHREMNTAR